MNKGLNLRKEAEELRGDEYKFGATSDLGIFLVPMDKRKDYLPVGEAQNIGEEKYGCVTRGYFNILETKLTYAYQNKLLTVIQEQFLLDNAYVYGGRIVLSDAFIEILSGTTKEGNSMKAPAHAIHECGCVPKHLLPQLKGFDEHYNKNRITPELIALGKEFLKHFPVNYEQVYVEDMAELLLDDSVNIAINGYGELKNGEYQRTEAPENHAVMAFSLPKTYIFDNYTDANLADGEWVKKLAENYKIHTYGYRVYIVKPLSEVQIGIMKQIINALLKLVGLYQKQVDELPKPEPVKESPSDLLYELSRSHLGKRLTLDSTVPKELGCAQAVSTILKFSGYNIPKTGISGTYTLYEWLQKNFEEIPHPEKGCVVISPTTVSVGHVGICGAYNFMYKNDFAVMSNNSSTGLYDTHWKLKEWNKYYKELNTYYFRAK